MNKQSMWFLTLFSLILVLSVYYVTMPNELLLQNNSSYVNSDSEVEDVIYEKEDVLITISESEEIVALKVEHDEAVMKEMNELQQQMLSEDITIDEKNSVFEQIQLLTSLQGKEEKIEEKLKSTYKIDNFVEIDNSIVRVVVAKRDHDVNLANDMMKSVQEEFDSKMYITIKFADN